jgi:hypothetical protein
MVNWFSGNNNQVSPAWRRGVRESDKDVGRGMNHGRDSGKCRAISISNKKQQLRTRIAIYKKANGLFVISIDRKDAFAVSG